LVFCWYFYLIKSEWVVYPLLVIWLLFGNALIFIGL
jgi:hypothetical protein